ncbi:hypothetical protein GN244_ATG18538 [Phytophthora infestans]|uniref:Uncharacterized protein n=1 Tax=Phytophthora infestans TaxID=4787 RepID=A0A833SNN5_PHYIN|nr:hypothetical protein GN244_ATG18538 [Phytophthora infestans]
MGATGDQHILHAVRVSIIAEFAQEESPAKMESSGVFAEAAMRTPHGERRTALQKKGCQSPV